MLHQLQGEMLPAAHRPRRLGERHGRRAEHRPAVALTEGGEPFDLLHGVERQAGERRLAVDRQLRHAGRRRQPVVHRREEGLAERVDPSLLDLQAGRRLVAAVSHQQVPAGGERRADVEPRHAPHAAGRRQAVVGRLRDHHHRTVKPLDQPPGHDADHALVPAAIGEHERRIVDGVEVLPGLLRGRQQDAPLLGLTGRVELVQEVRQRLRPGRVGRREQFDPAADVAHPAGGVEPGGELEGHVLAVDPAAVAEPGHLDEPRDAGPAVVAQAGQRVLHEDPVLVEQRHHVGHRAQGRQADRPQQHAAQPRRHLLCPAGPRGDRPGQLEGHAGAAQVAEGIGGARQPRMDEHVGRRQRLVEMMMVGDDELHAQGPGPSGRLHGGDPAVHRDDQAAAVGGERLDGPRLEAVAVLEAVGHVPADAGADRLEAAQQDRGAAHAVGVVVAVHHDPAAGPGRGQDPVRRLGHPGQRLGVAEVGEAGREEGARGPGVGDPAGDEQGRDDARHAGRPFQAGDGAGVVRTDEPAFRHGPTPFCRGGPRV